ncbi:MAG: cation:proton antiporter regulatory subunit [Acidimicrobiia bacterium]
MTLPEEFVGLSIDDVASRLRKDHRATLLAVARNGATHTNPGQDFQLAPDDDLVVVAESLGALQPLRESSALA